MDFKSYDCTSLAASNSESARHLLDIAYAQNLPFGHEYSTKLGSGRLIIDRHLFTFPREAFGNTPKKFFDLLYIRLKLPNFWLQRMEDDWHNCTHIHLGSESNSSNNDSYTLTWKVYFEFADDYYAARQLNASRWTHVHRAYKWNPSNPNIGTVSAYDALVEPGLAPRLAFLAEVLGADPELHAAVQRLLKRALSKLNFLEPMLLRVTDENTSRLSLDLNLYPAELALTEVAPELRQLAACCGVRSFEFERWLERFAPIQLGHMAAGTSADGQAFVTLYGGMQEWER